MLQRREFINPSVAVGRSSPPSGPDWVHEVMFGGWRAQLHKDGDDATIYSRWGRDLTSRFPYLRDSIRCPPTRSAVIDAELAPYALQTMAWESANSCAWCFDLLRLNGGDLRREPLSERKDILRGLLVRADDHVMQFAEEFEDALKLLAVARGIGLEGIVSKRADQPYVSGRNTQWVKVRAAACRNADVKRGARLGK